jgi:Glycoside hydrolase family 44
VNAVQTTTRVPKKRAKRRTARWKPLLLILTSALIIGGVLTAADVFMSATTLTVQMPDHAQARIDLNESLTLSPYLLGSNVFPLLGTNSKDLSGQGFMSYDPQVVSGLRSAGVKVLRFPGGDFGEHHTLSAQQLDAFSNLLNQVGAEGFMQVQLSDPLDKTAVPLTTRATRAALLVDYMNSNQSIQRSANATYHAIKYWSVGNEPDLLTNPDTGKNYTVAEYTQAFIAYSLAMHTKDPSIHVFGPELSQYPAPRGPNDSRGTPWMQGFLQGVSEYERTHNLPFQLLNGVSFHYYPFRDDERGVTVMLNDPTQWATILPGLRQLIRQTFGEDLPVAITEINTNAGKVPLPQNLSALWWAETLGELMDNQVDYVTFFSTEGVDSPNPLFLQKDLTETPMLRVMQVFSHVESHLVPVRGAPEPVRVYATQDDDHASVSLFFVNQTNLSQHISVPAERILSWGPWQGIQAWSSWQDASLTLPGYSMAVLTLHRNGSNEVFTFNNSVSAQQGAPPVQHVVCSSAAGIC